MSLPLSPIGSPTSNPLNPNDLKINALINNLKNSKDLSKRIDAAFELGWAEEVKGVEALCEALKDPAPKLRFQAAESLGNILIPEAVLPLCDALKDTNKEVRCAAANALGEHKDIRSKQALLEALNDTDIGVRYASAHALVRIDPKDTKIIQAVKKEIKDPELRFYKTAIKSLKESLRE